MAIALDTERHRIDIQDQRQLVGDDIDEVLEVPCIQHRQYRAMHLVLTGEVGARRTDQRIMVVPGACEVGLQTADHEPLHVDDAVGFLCSLEAGRRGQQTDQFRMAQQEIRVLLQVSHDRGICQCVCPTGLSAGRLAA